jgi:hypothetical protein
MGERQASFSEESTYEQDLYAWALKNAALLREGRLSEIDAEHIAEELEDMGKSERRALRSYLRNLMMHLLKWQYQLSHRGVSWKLSIRNARHEIQIIIKDSPSLQRAIPALVTDEYSSARSNAIDETGFPETAFPPACPYSIEQMLDEAFWPEIDLG